MSTASPASVRFHQNESGFGASPGLKADENLMKSSKAQYMGHLLKKATSLTGLVRSWRWRYCMALEKSFIYFSKDPNREIMPEKLSSEDKTKSPRREILYRDIEKVVFGGCLPGRYYYFDIITKAGNIFSFALIDDEKNIRKWVDVLCIKIRLQKKTDNRVIDLKFDTFVGKSNFAQNEEAGFSTELDTDEDDDYTKSNSSKKRFSDLITAYPAPLKVERSAGLQAAAYNSLYHNDWRAMSLFEHTRIFCREDDRSNVDLSKWIDFFFGPRELKAQCTISSGATQVFALAMDLTKSTRGVWDPSFESGRVVKVIDSNNDIIDVKLKSPMKGLPGSDIRLYRHWRREVDGTFKILYMSNESEIPGSSKPADDKQGKRESGIEANLNWAFITITPKVSNISNYACIVTYGMCLELPGIFGWCKPVADSYIHHIVANSVTSLRRFVEDPKNQQKVVQTKKVLEATLTNECADDSGDVSQQQTSNTKSRSNKTDSETNVRQNGSNINPGSRKGKNADNDDDGEDEGRKQDNQANESAEMSLDYHYYMPENNYIYPREISKDQISCWWDSGVETGFWNVRGQNYLDDGVKIPNETSAMELLQIQWSFFDEPKRNIANDPEELVQLQHAGRKDRPFLFVINFMVPTIGNWVCYFTKRRGFQYDRFDKMLEEFIEGDDEYRNSRFKIIPNVVEGSYFASKAIGSKPAILGTKIVTEYYRGDNWFEVCVDVGSSRVAGGLMGVVKSYATSLVMDLAFLFEAQSYDELPEILLGGCRMHQPLMYPVDDPLEYVESEEKLKEAIGH